MTVVVGHRRERLWQYLQTMFPLHRAVPVSLLSFFVTWATAVRVVGLPMRFEPRLLAGAASVTLFALLLRVMDEFKDVEVDRRLFPDRPLITGMVTRRDLGVLGWTTVGLLVALNAWQGAVIGGAFAVCLIYTSLMFKFFFWPRVRSSLRLALLTHNPVVFLFQCYTLSYVVRLAPEAVPSLLPVGLLFWLPWLAWEIARKIRAPRSEDDYETYSQNFGVIGACTIVVAIVSAIFVGTVWVSRCYDHGSVVLWGVGAATAYVVWRSCAFCRAPVAGKAPLRAVIESYLIAFYAAFSAVQFLG